MLDNRQSLLVVEEPEPEDSLAVELQGLAGKMAAALLPVEPRPDFVRELAARLQAEAASEPEATRRRRTVWLLAGAGGLLSLVGLTVVGLRLRTIWQGGRSLRPVSVKARA